MSYFTKNRITILILSFLLIISLTVIVTMLLTGRRIASREAGPHSCFNSVDFLGSELNLSEEQKQRLSGIRTGCMDNSGCLMNDIRNNNASLLEELSKENPDSLVIDSIARRVGDHQAAAIRLTAAQYLRIKAICTPEQQKKLSSLYFEIMGCGAEKGGGVKARNRHGQRGCNN